MSFPSTNSNDSSKPIRQATSIWWTGGTPLSDGIPWAGYKILLLIFLLEEDIYENQP